MLKGSTLTVPLHCWVAFRLLMIEHHRKALFRWYPRSDVGNISWLLGCWAAHGHKAIDYMVCDWFLYRGLPNKFLRLNVTCQWRLGIPSLKWTIHSETKYDGKEVQHGATYETKYDSLPWNHLYPQHQDAFPFPSPASPSSPLPPWPLPVKARHLDQAVQSMSSGCVLWKGGLKGSQRGLRPSFHASPSCILQHLLQWLPEMKMRVIMNMRETWKRDKKAMKDERLVTRLWRTVCDVCALGTTTGFGIMYLLRSCMNIPQSCASLLWKSTSAGNKSGSFVLSICLLYQHGINCIGFQEFQGETRAPCSHGWQHVPVLLRSFRLLLDPPNRLVVQVYTFKHCGIGDHTINQQNFDWIDSRSDSVRLTPTNDWRMNSGPHRPSQADLSLMLAIHESPIRERARSLLVCKGLWS